MPYYHDVYDHVLRTTSDLEAARDALRQRVAGPGPDRYLAPDIAAAVELVRSGRLVAAAEAVCGPLL